MNPPEATMWRALRLACVYGFLALAIVTGPGLRAGSRWTVVEIESLGASRG